MSKRLFVFDLGNVLMPINEQRFVDGMLHLGAKRSAMEELKEQGLLHEFETGRIEEGQFLNELKAVCPPDVSHKQIKDAWNSILLAPNKMAVALAQHLSLEHRTVVLSNTNPIHVKMFEPVFERIIPPNGLSGLFSALYYSHEIGSAKPESAIYQYLMQREKADQYIFFDDKEENLLAAREFGWTTKRIDRNTNWEDLKLFLR